MEKKYKLISTNINKVEYEKAQLVAKHIDKHLRQIFDDALKAFNKKHKDLYDQLHEEHLSNMQTKRRR